MFLGQAAMEALSVIQPDVSKTGGLLETRKIAAMAEEFTHYVDQSYTSLTEPVSLDGEGFLQVWTTPGIGVALNEDVLKERTNPEFHPL